MRKAIPFGKYILLDRLNVGGMAEVFIAKALALEGIERFLAIKKILPTMAEDDEFIRMFIDEARISVQLNHANVVHIHELGKVEDSYFIAMEYVAGKDVRTLLERYRRRKEKMPVPQAVFIACKICEGLDYAHRKKDARGQDLGIIHRDVSPQNILVSYEGEVKIIDFGIAKAANRSQKTQAGILKGKFGYMSPEQVRGQPIDRRSDIFALGVILYELLTGEKLFTGESDYSVLEKVRNAEVPPARNFNPGLSSGLERVLNKALAREPEQRYQWASDLQEDLMRFLVDGDQIYTSKHLSSFMKETFAEDIKREAQNMERYATEGEEAEAQGRAPASEPAFGEDAEESADKTQLIDSSMVAASVAEEPPADATRADAVNPFAEQNEAPAPKPTPGGVPRVVIGEGGAYSGATVVAQVSQLPELPPAGAPVHEATRLLDTSRRPSGSFPINPVTNEATRIFESQPPVPAPPGDAVAPEDATDSELRVSSSDLDTDAQRKIAPVEDDTDAQRRMDALSEDSTDAERRIGGLDEDSTDAERRIGAAEAQSIAADDHEEDSRGDLIRPAPKPAPARGESPIDRARVLFQQHRRWLVPAAAGVLALILVVSVAALVGHKPKGSAVMFKVTRPTNAEVRFDGKRMPVGVVVMVPPGMHEAVFSAPGYATETKEILVAKNRPPMAIEVALRPRGDSHDGASSPGPKSNPPGPSTPAVTPPPGSTAASATHAAPATHPQVATGNPKESATKPPEVKAPAQAPSHFSARFEADQDGVAISVDGKAVGKTPSVKLENLVVGTTYHFTAKLSGYRSYSGSFGSKGEEAVVVPVELEKLEPAHEHAAVVPVHHEHASVEPAHHERTASHRALRKALGRLACSTHPAGAEIWVDHRNTGRQTPVALSNPLMLPVGSHTVVFRRGSRRSEPVKVVIDEKETAKLVNVPLE